MKYRITAVILILIILITTVSCGGGGKDKTAVTTASSAESAADATTEIPKLPPSVTQTDLEGFELKINHHSQQWLSWAKNILDVEEMDGDLFNDAIFERNRLIEEMFNCKISVTDQERIGADHVSKEVMAGLSTYDVWYNYDIWVLNAIEYLMPWEVLDYIDLGAEWWNPSATDVFELNGNHYAAASNFSVSVLSRCAGFAFDKDVYEQLGTDSLYSIVDNNKWTVDKMAETCVAAYSDLNGNSQMDDGDRFGVNSSFKELYNRFFLGSGISYVGKDDEGFPLFTLPDDVGAINKIQHIIELFSDRRAFNPAERTIAESGGMGSFNNSTLLFVSSNLLGLENLRALENDIGFVPNPKYDEAQDRYYAPSFGAEIAVLLKTLPEDRMDNTGMLMEALSYYSDKFVIPMYKEVLLKTKYTRDNESEAMIDIIINSVSFEFGLNAWQDTVANPFVIGAIVKENGNVVSTLESMRSSVDYAIQKLNEKLLSM